MESISNILHSCVVVKSLSLSLSLSLCCSFSLSVAFYASSMVAFSKSIEDDDIALFFVCCDVPAFFSMVTILFSFSSLLAFYTRSEELSSDEVHSSSRTRQKTPESFLCGDSPSRSHQRRELTPFRTRLPRWTCCSSRTHDVELIRYFTLIENRQKRFRHVLCTILSPLLFFFRIGDFQERIVVHAPHVLWEACRYPERERKREREKERERKRKSSSHPREQNKKKKEERNVHV